MIQSLSASGRQKIVGPRQTAGPAALRGSLWVAPAGLLCLILGLAYFGLADSRWKLVLTAAAGLFVCLGAYASAGRLTPRYYAPRLLILSCGLQLLALAAIAALGLPLSPPYHPFEVNAVDGSGRVVLAILTVPLGALLAAALCRLFRRSLGRPAADDRPADVARSRRLYLILAAGVYLLFWPAAMENSGALGYATRVLASALLVSPFLAGRDSRHDRKLAMLWGLTVLINAGIGLAAGARSKAFVAAVIFVAGYISALPKGRRIAASACALVALVPLMQLSGAVGVVRNDLGRGGLELLQPDHIRQVVRRLAREMTPGNRSDSEDLRIEGVSRMLAWTNVVVPLMTPEAIPYRGLGGLTDEAIQTLRVASISGQTADDLYDAGLFSAPAGLYGFTVNSGTSVEFTLAADGWSRGGVLVALLFSFVAGVALIAGEACAYRWHACGAGVATIVALPVAKAAFFDVNIVPLLPMIRTLGLDLLAVAALVAVTELARRAARPAVRRRIPGPALTPIRDRGNI